MKRDKLFYFEQLFRSNFINRVAQLNLHVYAYCSDLQLVKKKIPRGKIPTCGKSVAISSAMFLYASR